MHSSLIRKHKAVHFHEKKKKDEKCMSRDVYISFKR
jgi:hypothetical protein